MVIKMQKAAPARPAEGLELCGRGNASQASEPEAVVACGVGMWGTRGENRGRLEMDTLEAGKGDRFAAGAFLGRKKRTCM